MDIDTLLRYISQQSHDSATGVALMAETYEVVWNGTIEKQEHDRQVRPAPELATDRRGHTGNKGHVVLQGERHATKPEDATVTPIRENWRRRETAIRTSGLPRGEYVKT
jgi:hypothetical protein